MTAFEYIDTVVLPTVLEFVDCPDDRRLAYLSCIATYHAFDHIGHACGTSNGPVIDAVDGRCRAAREVVHGLCNGTKHPRRGKLPSPDEVQRAPAFAWDTPGAGWDEGFWDGPTLYVQLGSNTLFVHQCVQAVLLTLADLYPDQLGGLDVSVLQSDMIAWHKESARGAQKISPT